MLSRSSALLRDLLATIGVMAWTTLSSCYDWTLGPSPRDAGGQRDAIGVDALLEEGGPSSDGAMTKPDGSGLKDAASRPLDARDASDCGELEANVRSAYTAAIACPVAGFACAAVMNECGCNVYVPTSMSSTTTTYLDAVKTLKSSGCSLACAGSCVVGMASECLESAGADGGFVTTCFQGQAP